MRLARLASSPALGVSPEVHRTLTAIAETALPAGRVFRGAGAATVDKVVAFLATEPEAAMAYRGLVAAIDGHALMRHRRRFAELEPAQQLALLGDWRDGGFARRTALRALVTPLKVAHFDDPAFYRHLGCVYETTRPRPEAKPAWWRERCHAAKDLHGDLAVDADVVVIGTGAGGAVIAKELAEAGVAVVMIEEGHFFERQDFDGRPFPAQRAMYRGGGTTLSVGNLAIPIPIGQTVGGSTTINSGTCYRAPDRVLTGWQRELGLDELGVDALAPYYERVERILGVAPARAELLGGNARVIARGCDAIGFKHHGPLKRNAPDCDGQGVCCFGCPTDAKRSTNVSYVPLAMKAGAELFHGCAVDRVIIEGGRAVGVVARARGTGARLTVRARAVVVACGSLVTPIFLEKNHLAGGSGQLGRNLSIHPAGGCLATFDEVIAGWNAIPQGYSVSELHDEGILMEGAVVPLEFTMSLSHALGPELTALAEGYDKVASFGFMVEDTSRGRVRLVGGRPVITYVLNDADLGRLKRGFETLTRILLAAGARSVIMPIHGQREITDEAGLDRLRQARIRASDLELSAYHPLGTARMGKSAAHSVVDMDHQVHDTRGLYVVDGAAVPSSLGVNPQVTIMALATRAAAKLARTLS
ncbi:MAG: GMC family oxidoreductase N-terminal domain-containing protein [Deltaproteobacteria bacterium]|nr:GMC family oxidoreductase N-terminal domain-containing protein [Deltaproteobacteria bacterium]